MKKPTPKEIESLPVRDAKKAKELVVPRTEFIEREGFGYEPFYDWLDEEMAEFEASFKKRKLITKEVLTTWDKARDSDRLLDFECLRTEFPDIQVTSGKDMIIFKIPKKIVPFLPSPETYTRARRKLIADASKQGNWTLLKQLVPTNPAIIEKRSKREKAIREYFGKVKGDMTILK